MVPPGPVERVVGTPPGDVLSVDIAMAVFIRIGRTELGLRVEANEGVHIGAITRQKLVIMRSN